jgi:hypothetical protein
MAEMSVSEWYDLLQDLKRLCERYGLEPVKDAVRHLEITSEGL